MSTDDTGRQVSKEREALKRFEMLAPPEWFARVDDWRRQQPDIPSRADAIRRLVDVALKAAE
jgi:hypothetical protein